MQATLARDVAVIVLCYATPAIVGAVRETVLEGAVGITPWRKTAWGRQMSFRGWAFGPVRPLLLLRCRRAALENSTRGTTLQALRQSRAVTRLHQQCDGFPWRYWQDQHAGPGTCTALVLGMLACLYVSLWFYARHLPVRWFPGRFDIVGNSHQARAGFRH